jgi:hypothetical protein
VSSSKRLLPGDTGRKTNKTFTARVVKVFFLPFPKIKEVLILHNPNESIETVLSALGTDRDAGISSSAVAAAREKYGENRLREKKKKTTFQRFVDQFKDVMIIILLLAALVSLVTVCMEQNWAELFEPGLILLIVVLNAAMGVYQEGKAEHIHEFSWGFGTECQPEYRSIDSFLMEDFESGTYYFTVTSRGDYKEYRNSDTAVSDKFTYVRPDDQLDVSDVVEHRGEETEETLGRRRWNDLGGQLDLGEW